MRHVPPKKKSISPHRPKRGPWNIPTPEPSWKIDFPFGDYDEAGDEFLRVHAMRARASSRG